MPLLSIPFITVLVTCVLAAAVTKKLTPAGALAGGVLSCLLFAAFGWMGLALMAAFFIAATVAGRVGKAQKATLGIAEEAGGRTVAQVAANGGVAALAAAVALAFPQYGQPALVAMATSFSAAAADTLASELGTVYGRRFFNILTLKKDTRGLDGVVSAEGFMAGLLGSVVVAFTAMLFVPDWQLCLAMLTGGTVGNITDSVLGATVERRGWLGNNAVNFLGVMVGAVVGVLVG